MQETLKHPLEDLATIESPSKSCVMVYLKLITLPTLAYLYFILGFLDVLHFKVGIHSLVLIGFIYLVALVFAKHNGEFGACTFRSHEKTFEKELYAYIAANKMPIGTHAKSNASFENFINAYTKRIRNDNYASVAAGIFPTMGILGTFISIALTLPDFSSQSASALEHEISLLLSGVGTAFYVSIYGILLSLWWIFFEKRGLSRFDRAVAQWQEQTAPLFWTKEEIEHAYLKENLQHFENIGKMFERLSSSDFFERLGRTIEQKFSLFDEMLNLEGQAVKQSAEHFKEGIDTLAASHEKHKGLLALHEEMLSKIDTYNHNAQSLHVSVQTQYEEILLSYQGLIDALKENASTRTHDESNLEVQALKESLKIIDAQTEEIIQKMDALK